MATQRTEKLQAGESAVSHHHQLPVRQPAGNQPHPPGSLLRHRSLIAGYVVKPSVQRLSGDECPCRVMVLSAVSMSRRMMVSEAPAS
jgi:hypothetical protein